MTPLKPWEIPFVPVHASKQKRSRSCWTLSVNQADHILQVNALTKCYAKSREPAVADLDFTVEKGEIFGFLGPNGAGKTTTISIMATLMKPTRGSVSICGIDIVKHPLRARKLISLVPQEIALYHELTGRENLHFFGTMYGLKGAALEHKIAMGLEFFNLDSVADQPIAHCSGGIKRRFNIACGILHDPVLVFLDEPTVGMDVHSRNVLLDQIQNLSARGSTILYTTHYMEEAEKICSRVLIMDKGIHLASGPPLELIQQSKSSRNLGDLFLTLTGKHLPN
ncbi:MAG: ABC transporter ATP-binding protein [Desulfobacterium sp.]|nr:ABC transporter ATP-binding protein [Desulfobacterium sp.]